jgi:hypothetical protein
VVTDLHNKNNSDDQLQQNLDNNSSESVNQSQRFSVPHALTIHRSVQIPTKKSRESIPYKVINEI